MTSSTLHIWYCSTGYLIYTLKDAPLNWSYRKHTIWSQLGSYCVCTSKQLNYSVSWEWKCSYSFSFSSISSVCLRNISVVHVNYIKMLMVHVGNSEDSFWLHCKIFAVNFMIRYWWLSCQKMTVKFAIWYFLLCCHKTLLYLYCSVM